MAPMLSDGNGVWGLETPAQSASVGGRLRYPHPPHLRSEPAPGAARIPTPTVSHFDPRWTSARAVASGGSLLSMSPSVTTTNSSALGTSYTGSTLGFIASDSVSESGLSTASNHATGTAAVLAAAANNLRVTGLGITDPMSSGASTPLPPNYVLPSPITESDADTPTVVTSARLARLTFNSAPRTPVSSTGFPPLPGTVPGSDDGDDDDIMELEGDGDVSAVSAAAQAPVVPQPHAIVVSPSADEAPSQLSADGKHLAAAPALPDTPLMCATGRKGRARSGAMTEKRRLHIGFLNDCEKCQARVPGHYSHLLPA